MSKLRNQIRSLCPLGDTWESKKPAAPKEVLRSAPINRKQANNNGNAVAVIGSRHWGNAPGSPAAGG